MIARIEQIWSQLEANDSSVAGLFKIRFSDTSKCDVFLGVKFPEKYRMLIIRTPFSIGKEFDFHYDFRGLKFDKIYDPDNSKFLLLNLILIDDHSKDVFDTLIADVLSAIIKESVINVILNNYSNRLIKWESLFERFKQQGLTPDEQRGLYGELFFLRKFLEVDSSFQQILNSWIGPEKEIWDFQHADWAVEVKTTHGNNHQKISVSNERQLDTNAILDLFLYHISLESKLSSGESLNQIVDSIAEMLNKDIAALQNFKNKIIEVGYFTHHRELYDKVGYEIRNDAFYKVKGSFPRIEEKDIRAGVGDVRYSIIVSNCSEFLIESEKVINTIKFIKG